MRSLNYFSYGNGLVGAQDRRRVVCWATECGYEIQDIPRSRKLRTKFLIQERIEADLAVITLGGDVSIWSEIRRDHRRAIFDIVDSYWREPLFCSKRPIRAPYKYLTRQYSKPLLSYVGKIKQIAREADLVLCASHEQADFLRQFNSSVAVIPDCQQELIRAKHDYTLQKSFKLLWEGYPENIDHFSILEKQIAELSRRYDVVLTLVTKVQQVNQKRLRNLFPTIPLRLVDWSVANLSTEVARSDLAIIPISSSNSMAFAKPENKLLSFWKMGLPVCASSTPSYSRLMSFLNLEASICNPDDWADSIGRHIEDTPLRIRNAISGFDYAHRITSLSYGSAEFKRLTEFL